VSVAFEAQKDNPSAAGCPARCSFALFRGALFQAGLDSLLQQAKKAAATVPEEKQQKDGTGMKLSKLEDGCLSQG